MIIDKVFKFFKKIKLNFSTSYDEKDAIGRRYRRQDAIGTPYCITVDHQTVTDNTVTVRKLGSEKQETIKREDLIKNMRKANKLPLN